jgi:hypothetical protein
MIRSLVIAAVVAASFSVESAQAADAAELGESIAAAVNEEVAAVQAEVAVIADEAVRATAVVNATVGETADSDRTLAAEQAGTENRPTGELADAAAEIAAAAVAVAAHPDRDVAAPREPKPSPRKPTRRSRRSAKTRPAAPSRPPFTTAATERRSDVGRAASVWPSRVSPPAHPGTTEARAAKVKVEAAAPPPRRRAPHAPFHPRDGPHEGGDITSSFSASSLTILLLAALTACAVLRPIWRRGRRIRLGPPPVPRVVIVVPSPPG